MGKNATTPAHPTSRDGSGTYVQITRFGTSMSESGPVMWSSEAHDPVDHEAVRSFFVRDSRTWSDSDADGWFVTRVPWARTPDEEAPARFDVQAVRWVPSAELPEAEHFVARRELRPDGRTP